MGIYINTNLKGEYLPATGKASALIADGATRQTTPHYVHDRSVCVVENGSFDAAAFAFDQREFDAFMHDGSMRRKHWLELSEEQRVKLVDDSIVANYRGEPVVRGRVRDL